MKKISDIFGFYLPKKWRRFYIYLPLNLILFVVLFFLTVCIYSLSVNGEDYFSNVSIPKDVDLQFQFIHNSLIQANQTDDLDICKGYSSFCGNFIEWQYIFYTFYSMALYELSKTQPSRIEFAKNDLDLCARRILHLPEKANPVEINKKLTTTNYGASSLMGGYYGVVLGLRKLVFQDSVFDVPLNNIIESLESQIEASLKHSTEFWTADQATQLYAIWLYDQATGSDHSQLFNKWVNTMESRFIDDKSGLLISKITINPDDFVSVPRASSVSWTIIFLVDVYPDFVKKQYEALCNHREHSFGTFSFTSEFSRFFCFQPGDSDSGPLFFGVSPSATGFSLCSHKLFGNKKQFTNYLRTFEVFACAKKNSDGKRYRLGNLMGDAILLYGKIAAPRF